MPTYVQRRIKIQREWIASSNAEWIAHLYHKTRGRWEHFARVRGGGSPARALERTAVLHVEFFAPEHVVTVTIEKDTTAEQAKRAYDAFFGVARK